jgi:hypothetical protein
MNTALSRALENATYDMELIKLKSELLVKRASTIAHRSRSEMQLPHFNQLAQVQRNVPFSNLPNKSIGLS